MAKFEFTGLEEYVRKINRLANPKLAEGMIKAAIYPGAGIIADEIRRNLEPHRRTGDLASSLYLAHMVNENGYIFTEIGFAGYDRNGAPNEVKARALESGTSKQKKTPFIRPALNTTKDRAEAAIAAELESRIKQIMED